MSLEVLERLVAPNLQEMGGVVHGFGTRLSPHTDDGLFQTNQVHGCDVVLVRKGDDPHVIRGLRADALVTLDKGVGLAVRTADCLPILIYAPDIPAVAAVHAGWKGTLSGVARRTLLQLRQLEAGPENLKVAFGPCIAEACYEVGPEVAASFRRVLPQADLFLKNGRTGRFNLDLGLANQILMEEMGVRRENIWRSGYCTHCRADLFHSYRRDGAKTGRLTSSIALT